MVPIRHRASEPCRECRDDDSFLSSSRVSEDPRQTRKGLLRIGDGARRPRERPEIARVVHPARSGHEPFASTIPDHEIQEMDAKRPRALVGCAAAGNGDLHGLVCPHLFPN